MQIKTEEELENMNIIDLQKYANQLWAHNVKVRTILKMKELNK